MSQPLNNVVIPIVAGIGNALMTVPMIRRLKRAQPDCHITILARIDAMGEVFRRLPEVNETLITGKGLAGIKANISESHRRHPDLYLIPFPSNRWQYSLLALTSGARRAMLHSYPVGQFRSLQFIGTRIPARRGIHDVEQNLRLLTLLDIEPGRAEAPTFAIADTERQAAAQLLSIDRPIAIHAGSARTILAQAKRWPAESYGSLIDRLEDEFGPRLILLEGPDERGVADEILAHVKTAGPQVIRLTGSLGEAAAVLERAEFYVGSDSGLAHLAAAVGTPPVTLFAPADPERVCPFGYRHLVVQAPTPCAPCFRYPYESPHPKLCCREPFRIRRIDVDAVMHAVRRATVPAASENAA